MRHVMLDLETMGTTPWSAIVQIGAVEFSIYKVGEPFKVNVSLESCVSAGLRIDPRTVVWWMRQSDQVRNALFIDTVSLQDALTAFTDWLGKDPVCVWGDGAAFDNSILQAAYRAARMPCPWSYQNDRCFRTMKNMYPLEHVASELLHDAAADAVAQAEQMRKIIVKHAIMLQ